MEKFHDLAIRYFFITAGTGRLRYEFLLPFLQTDRVDGKTRVRNLHHIKVKSVRGVTMSLKSMVVFLKRKCMTEQVYPTETQNLLGKEARADNIFRVRPVGRRSRGGQGLIANNASRRRPFPVENSHEYSVVQRVRELRSGRADRNKALAMRPQNAHHLSPPGGGGGVMTVTCRHMSQGRKR